VFQAAGAVGATPDQVSSWMLALGVGIGLTCVLPSLRYRAPGGHRVVHARALHCW
jgi:benzoate membrane transport protein